MPFCDPPPLPDYAAPLRVLGRRGYRLEQGEDAGKRIHFVDHGRAEAMPIVLCHGNPTWSFLWRRVIACLDPARYRCLAPDLLGFGLSDDLSPRARDHTLDRHVRALSEWLSALGLGPQVVLVAQDWGGPMLCAAALRALPSVAGLVLGNTSILAPKRPRGTLFHRFARAPLVSDFVFRGLGFPQRGGLGIAQGDANSMAGAVGRAYRKPLEGRGRRSGPLGLARAVPNSPTHPSMTIVREVDAWARSYAGPVGLVWGERDPVLGRALRSHVEAFPQASVQRTQAGHFLQEEVPEALAAAIVDVVSRASLPSGTSSAEEREEA